MARFPALLTLVGPGCKHEAFVSLKSGESDAEMLHSGTRFPVRYLSRISVLSKTRHWLRFSPMSRM